MRVRNYKQESRSGINSKEPKLHLSQQKAGNRPKLYSSTERKIERLRFQSKRLCWNYSDFVLRLMAILVVLDHRNKVKAALASRRKTNTDTTP
jgi:hypothetical protein